MPMTEKKQNSKTQQRDIATNWSYAVQNAIRPAVQHEMYKQKHKYGGGGGVLHEDWFKSIAMLENTHNKKIRSKNKYHSLSKGKTNQVKHNKTVKK